MFSVVSVLLFSREIFNDAPLTRLHISPSSAPMIEQDKILGREMRTHLQCLSRTRHLPSACKSMDDDSVFGHLAALSCGSPDPVIV